MENILVANAGSSANWALYPAQGCWRFVPIRADRRRCSNCSAWRAVKLSTLACCCEVVSILRHVGPRSSALLACYIRSNGSHQESYQTVSANLHSVISVIEGPVGNDYLQQWAR